MTDSTQVPRTIVIKAFHIDGRTIRRDTPLILGPNRTNDGHFELDVGEELDMYLLAESTEKLKEQVVDLLQVMWESYVEDAEAHLTSGAQILRDRLRANYSVI